MSRLKIAPVVLGALTLSVGFSACSGAGGGGGGGGAGANSVSVLMVNNPQMVDLQKLAPEFTKESGITVNFTVIPENDLRDKASQEFSSQAGQYDVATLSNFEIPIYAKNKWVADLTSYTTADTAFDQADILAPMTKALTVDGKIYGEPFYGESSFLMYRKDVFKTLGITVPDNPTWAQVADWAAKADGAEAGMKGIC
ncbi:MAG: extracellular solute-binding protein, partial [Lapillicoccus sp.]